MNSTPTPVEKLHGLLADFPNAMLITHVEGKLRARPMAIASLDEDCQLWFISGRETAKIHEIETDTSVHIVCQNDREAYLSIEGTASLVSDREKVREIWKDSFKIWFPGGPEDPEIVLIEVTPIEAEYWDNHGTKGIRYMASMAKALVTGTTPETKEGDQHGFVRLWSSTEANPS